MRCFNDVSDGALAVDGFSQNRGKEELLMHLVGSRFFGRSLAGEGRSCAATRQSRDSGSTSWQPFG